MSAELVAEIGSNHNGDLDTVFRLIEAAKKSGATTVKFQHYPDDRYGPNPIPRSWLKPLKGYAVAHDLKFLCSVFDLRTLHEYVDECSPEWVKIASPELTDHKLLNACAAEKLHIILSTGMSTGQQIREAYYACLPARVTLLHCVSSYPSPPSEMNLRVMRRLDAYGDFGLSDHTLNPSIAPVVAVSLGASFIEKHFTLDNLAEGPDHSYALEPRGFAEMTVAVRLAEEMLGDGEKRVMPSEDPDARRTEEWRAA